MPYGGRVIHRCVNLPSFIFASNICRISLEMRCFNSLCGRVVYNVEKSNVMGSVGSWCERRMEALSL